MCKYECNACQTRTCTLEIRGTDGTPSSCPINGFTPTWRPVRDDDRPLIVWEDTECDPTAAIRQLQEYVGRMLG